MDSSAPTANHGTSVQLRVDGSPIVDSYLTFNVTGVSGTVTSATLRIWATSAQSVGYDAYSVSDTSWGENTITYANAPPFGAKLGSSGKVPASTWTSVDVTSAVTGNGLVSFGLSTTNSTALALSSRESGANAPQLVITWSGGAAVAVPPQPGGPNPLPIVLFLLIPILAPGLVVLERAPVRRALYGFRFPASGPGWLAPARAALVLRMRARGLIGSSQADGTPS